MAHTNGDWQRVWNTKNSPETCIIKAIAKDGSKKSICRIITNENDFENAKLIVAAPVMLEALKRFQEEWVVNGNPAQRANNYSIEKQINAVIKRATE